VSRIVDLTCPFDRQYTVPQYLHHNWRIKFESLFTFPRDGQRVVEFTMSTHTGTHVDSPSHVLEDGFDLDGYALSTFFGTGVVLDVTKGPKEPIEADDLERADVGVRSGDIVLLCTGWGRHFVEEPLDPYYLALNHPGLAVSGARWLVDRGVKAVGIDTYSIRGVTDDAEIDADVIRVGTTTERIPTRGRTEPVHQILLGNGVLICEQMTNLHEVVSRRCTISLFPLPFVGMDGAPVRAVAILD
jgi:kynurenine formamidase